MKQTKYNGVGRNAGLNAGCIAVLMLGLMGGPAVYGQGAVFRTGIDQVDVVASVRDEKGALVNNLEQTNFRVFEDGQEQEIKRFSREYGLPLTIGLLVDVSASVASQVGNEMSAASQFVKQVMRPQDQAFIMSFATEIDLTQDVTGDPKPVEAALDGLLTPASAKELRYRLGDQTALYESVYTAALHVLEPQSGRKVIILITDGVDDGSEHNLETTAREVLRANTIVYIIQVTGGMQVQDRDRAARAMATMAGVTGGRVFPLPSKNQMEAVFKQIEDELRSQYSVSYVSKKGFGDGSYRRIQLRVDKENYKVQARDGYFPRH